jgi:peptide/nickel transport system substrate-binding protein
MKRSRLILGGLVVAVAIAVASIVAASSATSAVKTSRDVEGGKATVDMASPPNSLDPSLGYTVEASEADWIVYTPLLTYAHKNGTAGTTLIPGLATGLPQISANGLIYTLTLRKGLKYSDGTSVKASDFDFAVKRALKLNWGASAFLQPIQGAGDYQSGKAKTISGISTNDATGKITIHLTSPVGAFANVLAFPATAPIPQTTPAKAQVTGLPPGVGAYTIKSVVPNVSFKLVKNPMFASFHLPGIPLGHLDEIDVNITSNSTSEAEAVLNNQVDAFDVFDALPPALLGQIESKAKDRYARETVSSISFFFLNQRIPPFNNILAREAAGWAIDRNALARLSGGVTVPNCHFLPVGIAGHTNAPCEFPHQDVAKAKALLQQAHLVGAPISVYGQNRSPQKEELEYYANALNNVGFKVSLKLLDPAIYWSTIGNAKTKPNTGFAGQFLDFPNPSDFFILQDARSIHAVNSNNFGNVDDPHIQATLNKLEKVPATNVQSVAKQWAALDAYQAKKAYEITWGSDTLVKFLSDRIDFKTAVFHPCIFDDWSTWQLTH